jgi:hypothetical protein
MKLLASMPLLLLLAACGGSGDGGSAKNDAAANACDAYAKQQLDGKTYKLDLTVLAASLTEQSGGMEFLKAPIVIDPGLTSESKQSLECTVRFTAGKDQPDVMKMQFIW